MNLKMTNMVSFKHIHAHLLSALLWSIMGLWVFFENSTTSLEVMTYLIAG